MSLDAHVRCGCLLEGRAKPHPFPDRLAFDEAGEPVRDASEEDYEAHDRWLAESSEHAGYLVSERLGNITLIAHVRDFLHGLQGHPGPRFSILLEKVVYDGTHTGDCISGAQSPSG